MSEFDWALLILRVVTGVTFAMHGINKVFWGGKIPGTARWFGSIGFKAPKMQAWTAALTEIGGGAMFALGLFTPLAAAMMVGDMTVAGWVEHRKHGFFIVKEGFEYVMILAVIGITVGIIGPGDFSIDHTIGIDDTLSGWTGGAIALAGLAVAIGQMSMFWRPKPTEA